jgi:two-component system OmpR family sensor kinase/two-component system sensor histidine kinase BaeS
MGWDTSLNLLPTKMGLTGKIILIVVLSALLTAAGSFAFSSIAGRNAFGAYVARSTTMRQQFFVAALEAYYEAEGSWKGVEELFATGFPRPRGQGGGSGMGPGMSPGMGGMWGGQMPALLDARGMVVFDPNGTSPGTPLRFEPWEGTEIRVDGAPVGFLLSGSAQERLASRALYQEFTGELTAGILYSTLGAAALALALGYYVAGRTLRPVKLLTDASERVRRGDLGARVEVPGDDEMARLARSFNEMSAALEDAAKHRREIVADVAHELRTPLAVLKSNFEGIKDGVVEGTPQLMESLAGEVDRLTRLVSDLHVLSLADAGKLDLRLELVRCSDLIAQTAGAHQATASARGIRLEVLPAEGAAAPVLADPVRLHQVLSNLVDNSFRHTPHGGTVTLKAAFVEEQGRRLARITVSDTGEGIPADDLPHVFERFYRGDKSRSRSTGGSGLGLAIAHDIVTAHGGTISVKSTAGRGSTFAVSLPLSEA